MANSTDTPKHDYLAAARSQMNAEPPTERNPFKAGLVRGRAASKGELETSLSDLKSSFQQIGHVITPRGWIFLASIVVVGILMKMGSPPDEQLMTYEQKAEYRESTAISRCNRYANKNVKNPTSYDRGNYRTVRQGNEWIVYQNFRAMNGFGAMPDGYFVCKYDFMTEQITDLQFEEGNY